MNHMRILLVLFIIINAIICHLNDNDSRVPTWELQMETLQKVLYEGKQQIDKLQSNAVSLTTDECYDKLMLHFHEDCKELDSIKKFRLALSVYNCQREESGFKVIECSSEESIDSCAQKMGSESNAYQTVVLLTHHVENMCYFVHSSQFQKQTSTIINLMASESLKAAEVLQSLNKDHEILKSQVRQTLTEQIKAFREHIKMSESIAKMNEINQVYHEKVERQYDSLLDRSKKLTTGMESIRSLQDILNKRQEEVRDMIDSHYENLKLQYSELSTSMGESLNLSKSIEKDHRVISEHVEKLHVEQKNMLEKLNLAEEKQNNLLEGQDDLIKRQDLVVKSTLEIENGIKKSTSMFHELMENSVKQHESLRNIVNDVSSHTQDVKTMQDKILEQARNGFQSLEEATEIATRNIRSMHENFESEFGKMYDFLHRIFYILSKLDLRLYVWTSILYYGASIILLYILTSLSVLRSARTIIIVVWLLSGVVECFIGSESRGIHQTIRWSTVILSVYILYRCFAQYRDISKETYDAVMQLRMELCAIEEAKQNNRLRIITPSSPSYRKCSSQTQIQFSPMDMDFVPDFSMGKKCQVNFNPELTYQKKITSYFSRRSEDSIRKLYQP